MSLKWLALWGASEAGKKCQLVRTALYGPRKPWILTRIAVEANDAQDIRGAALRDAEKAGRARLVGTTAAPLLNINGGSSDADGEKGDGSEELHIGFWWEDEPKV